MEVEERGRVVVGEQHVAGLLEIDDGDTAGVDSGDQVFERFEEAVGRVVAPGEGAAREVLVNEGRGLGVLDDVGDAWEPCESSEDSALVPGDEPAEPARREPSARALHHDRVAAGAVARGVGEEVVLVDLGKFEGAPVPEGELGGGVAMTQGQEPDRAVGGL